MQLTQTDAEKRISDLGMSDMPLVCVKPTVSRVAPDWFKHYKETVRQFMVSLTDSIETLAMMGLAQDEFMDLISGRAMPKNLSIRLRTPLTWGGDIDISNMFLCPTFPQSHNLDRFIIEQSGADKIWLPDPEKKIYIPVHTTGGGDGGNATEDRMSQIAAQMAASRDM